MFGAYGDLPLLTPHKGTPDLLLTFVDAKSLADCAFHPCVRYESYTPFQTKPALMLIPDCSAGHAIRRSRSSPLMESSSSWNTDMHRSLRALSSPRDKLPSPSR